MAIRKFALAVSLSAVVMAGFVPPRAVAARQTGAQSNLTPAQRLEVMRSRVEALRRTLNSAIAGLNASDSDGKGTSAEDARARLSGLEKESGSLLSEVSELRGKVDRAERFDPTQLDKLEAAAADLDARVQAGLRSTIGDRQATAANSASSKKKKGGGGFLGLGKIFGGGGDDKYDELIGTVAPGRDRQLFEDATKETRKDNYETARSLFNVIITTYPDSPFLPLAKLAIADTFYLEGTTSALVQAAHYYQDWLTFFPTDPLADDVMLKIAEVEMRKMGLPDRDVSSARKAEQRIKVLLQQFPQTALRPEAEIRLREIQEVLAKHNHLVANHYFERYRRQVANNPKGAQSRYREIVEKYPHYTGMAQVLARLAQTYLDEEEPDEAAKYLQQLVRYHPNSEYTDKAREQLAAIGVAAPDPDPQALTRPEPENPSFLGSLKMQFVGATPKTIDKKGILISGEKSGDLIDEALRNNGTLPVTTPTVPVRRSAPPRNVTPLPAPKVDDKKAISPQPTQPGPPKSGSDPTQPPATQPTQPATPPPPGDVKP
ncbi:MAG TPA: outer membrane protein assembly factor BamD [Pyrinomonadaceae bacterium]|nr:outer membrane protein assembly factor BamD [Pyrinomonadaceae bacterium]